MSCSFWIGAFIGAVLGPWCFKLGQRTYDRLFRRKR